MNNIINNFLQPLSIKNRTYKFPSSNVEIDDKDFSLTTNNMAINNKYGLDFKNVLEIEEKEKNDVLKSFVAEFKSKNDGSILFNCSLFSYLNKVNPIIYSVHELINKYTLPNISSLDIYETLLIFDVAAVMKKKSNVLLISNDDVELLNQFDIYMYFNNLEYDFILNNYPFFDHYYEDLIGNLARKSIINDKEYNKYKHKRIQRTFYIPNIYTIEDDIETINNKFGTYNTDLVIIKYLDMNSSYYHSAISKELKFPLLFYEALNVLKNGAALIYNFSHIHYYTVFPFFSIFQYLFESVTIYKPFTSYPYDLHFYVICMNFNKQKYIFNDIIKLIAFYSNENYLLNTVEYFNKDKMNDQILFMKTFYYNYIKKYNINMSYDLLVVLNQKWYMISEVYKKLDMKLFDKICNKLDGLLRLKKYKDVRKIKRKSIISHDILLDNKNVSNDILYYNNTTEITFYNDIVNINVVGDKVYKIKKKVDYVSFSSVQLNKYPYIFYKKLYKTIIVSGAIDISNIIFTDNTKIYLIIKYKWVTSTLRYHIHLLINYNISLICFDNYAYESIKNILSRYKLKNNVILLNLFTFSYLDSYLLPTKKSALLHYSSDFYSYFDITMLWKEEYPKLYIYCYDSCNNETLINMIKKGLSNIKNIKEPTKIINNITFISARMNYAQYEELLKEIKYVIMPYLDITIQNYYIINHTRACYKIPIINNHKLLTDLFDVDEELLLNVFGGDDKIFKYYMDPDNNINKFDTIFKKYNSVVDTKKLWFTKNNKKKFIKEQKMGINQMLKIIS